MKMLTSATKSSKRLNENHSTDTQLMNIEAIIQMLYSGKALTIERFAIVSTKSFGES